MTAVELLLPGTGSGLTAECTVIVLLSAAVWAIYRKALAHAEQEERQRLDRVMQAGRTPQAPGLSSQRRHVS